MYWSTIDAAVHFWDTKKQNQIIQRTKETCDEEDEQGLQPFKSAKFQDKNITRQDITEQLTCTFNPRHNTDKVKTFFWRVKKDPFRKFDRQNHRDDKYHWFQNKLPTPPPYSKFCH